MSDEADSLTLVVDLDAAPPEVYGRFLGALDRYHRALGGTGLTMTRSDAYTAPDGRQIGVFELSERHTPI